MGTPGSHASRLAVAAVAKMGLGAAVGLAGLVGVAAVGVSGLASGGASALPPAGFLAASVAGVVLFRLELPRFAKAAAGARSERRVAACVDNLGALVVVHGALLGSGGDADHLVAGPWAAVVETKTGAGPLAVRGAQLSVGGRVLVGDPVAQARAQAKAAGRRLGVWVDAVVCVCDLSSPPSDVRGVTVCSLEDLPGVFARLPRRTTAGCDELVRALSA